MKIVELEEQLEAIHKEQSENKLESLSDSEYNELLKKIDALTQENSELYGKLNKIEEKGASDTGSTESFEAIQVNDRNDLLKKIEDLEQKNNELTLKLTKLEEKDSSHAGSTESFETINDTDRSELLKKIEQLTQENNDLTIKLSRIEEKGSSDTGSTESFERIPEHNENITKIELLTQENNELVIKLTKLEEQLSRIESSGQLDVSKIDNTLGALEGSHDSRLQIETLKRENDSLMEEISELKKQAVGLAEEHSRLQDLMEVLKTENTDLISNDLKLGASFRVEKSESSPMSMEKGQQVLEKKLKANEKELAQAGGVSVERSITVTSCVTDDTKYKIAALERENAQLTTTISQLEERVDSQREKLSEITREKEKSSLKVEHVARDNLTGERLADQLEKLEKEKDNVAQERQEQISIPLLEKSSDEILEMRKTEEASCQESQAVIVASLEKEVENSKVLIVEYKNQIEEMNIKLQSMEAELQEKVRQLVEYEVSGVKLESLERELKDMLVTAEEWKFKYDDMQVKMQALEKGKSSIEETLRTLENGNKELLEVIKEKDAAISTLQEQFQDTVGSLETKLQDVMANVTAKEREIADLKAVVENKDQELYAKYAQLQNEMIAIDSLQDELANCTIKLKENETALSSSLNEIARLNDIVREKEKEIQTLKDNVNEINKALEQSKSLAEFYQVLDNLRGKETSYIELQRKHQDVLQENSDLTRKIEHMSKRDEEINNELAKKEREIANLLVVKEDLDVQIKEIKRDKAEAEKRLWELQMILDNQTAHVEKVQSDLTNEYKKIEQLKIKHTEDIAMLNRRLEDVIEELTAKVQENEAMRAELEQKEELLGKNITEEARITLEDKVADLEQKLLESENKLQAQSEKMKKIVATFNKKKIACQELEARVVELEEKWMTEKDEKEVKNKRIQEVENSMREKDNKIADLEEKLAQAKNDAAEALASSEKLTRESISLKEKMSVLMEQIAEMGEEIERQRAEIERVYLQAVIERTAKEDVAKEYELYKQTACKEDEQKQATLDEVKEVARELSVRMQVMETEYVEQLALIKNLQAENGLLSSKQAQINEKLENVEKESEERRVLIERLRSKTATMADTAVQVPEEGAREDGAQVAQHCDHSEQCQNLVQALEARLQERQAEIENLNNELANSYGNIVLLHDESLRYNDMMMQTAQERFNQSLIDRTNVLLQEIDFLKAGKIMSEQKASRLEAELEEYKRKGAECEGEISKTVEASVTDDQQRQQQGNDTSPRLFDAAKVFSDTSVATDVADASNVKEILRLRSLLNEKEIRCSEHAKEIDLLLKNIEEERSRVQKSQARYDDQAQHWKNQLEDAQSKLKQIEHLLFEKNAQIDSLNAELNVVEQQMSAQSQRYVDAEANLRTEISLKDTEIVALITELTSAKEAVETLTAERDRQSRKLQTDSSATKAQVIKNADDSDLIREWEQRISTVTTERDLLQLRVDDLTRSLEGSRESFTSQHNLQIELENALCEREQARVLIANLTRALEDSQQSRLREKSKPREDNSKELISIESPTARQQLGRISMPAEESIDQPEHDPVKKELRQETRLDTWDDSSEKFSVDVESWDWSAEDAQLVGEQYPSGTMTLIPDAVVQLRAQVGDLRDRIQDLEAQNAQIVEESKACQIKNSKLVKKLKEYKVQIESLQQRLKTQKQTDSFFDLDTAIEEELKIQIANLEKAFNEIKEEKKSVVAEKEALQKRLDVVVSANERYMEMKERQDMEVEVLRIRNKELSNKVQSLEWRLQENTTSTTEDVPFSAQYEAQIDSSRREIDTPVAHSQSHKRSPTDDFEAMSNKYKEEIDDLKDELEALASENEQLQHFLEEQKAAMVSNLESRGTHDIQEFKEKIDILNDQSAQLQSALNRSKEEYDALRKRYEQSLMDANDQVVAMQHNNDLLKIEFSETIDRLKTEIINLETALEEKEALEGKISALEASSEEKLTTVDASLMEVTELLNARVQEVADLKQELQNQYVERQRAEATLQSEIQNLTREVDERKQELGTLRQAFNDKEHELVRQRSMETVSAIVSEATQELVQQHAIEIEGKDKELHELAEKLMALQLTVDEYISKLQDSVVKLEAQQQQITRLKGDLAERESIIEATEANVNSINEKLQEKQRELIQREEEKSKLAVELERCLADVQHLQSQLNAAEAAIVDLKEYTSRIRNLEQQIQVLTSEKKSVLLQYDQERETYQADLESDKRQIDALKRDLQEKTEQLYNLNVELCAKENDLEGVRAMMTDKNYLLETTSQELNEKRAELERLRNEQPRSSKMIDGLPVFRMGNDDDAELQSTVDELRAQMEAKQQELEHLKCVIKSESTYSTIVQQMQDRINCLYNEKATLEASLRATTQTLMEKQEQVNLLTRCIDEQNQEHISKEEVDSLSRDLRRSTHDQEEIVRLQNQLHAKEQEINELKYIIAEKDSQLCLQASMEPHSDDFELRETLQRLTGELYGKEQEVQTLKATIAELKEEVSRLQNFEKLSEESKNAIEKLTSEKELIRVEAEKLLNRELENKEAEIDELKQRLSEEKHKLLAGLCSKNNDIENLKTQLLQLRDDYNNKLQQRENELMHATDDLAEKERRLAELSITKDAELHNLKMQIREKEARIEELLTLSAEEEKQLDELRQTLAARETEVVTLKELLEQKISEYELIQHALKKDVSVIEAAVPKSTEIVDTADNTEAVSSELNLALYMLHQRDVRCEELTHELMQLLEERDTLQLRLSNAIRVNEELRRASSVEASPTKDSSLALPAIVEPVVEQPSPSKSEGPVEIAKEAIDAPIEDKEALALK